MTERVKSSGAASTQLKWSEINWNSVESSVQKLQMRIAKATREGRYGKVKSLQWILTHSLNAKLLAIKRVTQNKGSKTPGIDGVIWDSEKKKLMAIKTLKRRGYKPSPLRRVYIPKKNGKQRPLGIPCMIDKAQQALYLLGIEPVSESLADPNTYGFRPKRSAADAIHQCFIVLSRKVSAQWTLEGDIKSCFDKIGHKWLLDNVPMDKKMLNLWLKSGYMDKGLFYHTEEGTPQGGIISPVLMLLTLKGLERIAKQAAPKESYKVNTIAYADDFIITGASKDILVDKVKPAVKAFLSKRGLELSEEKTKITHINDGFDFLGFNIRKYDNKLLIKPAKQNVLTFVNNIKGIIKSNPTMSAGTLIGILNPKLIGWGNYYKGVVSSKTFSYVDDQIYKSLCRWSKRRHPNKSIIWIMKKYFHISGTWKFSGWTKLVSRNKKLQQLFHLKALPIKRHIKIRADARLYDNSYKEYFEKRQALKRANKYRNNWYDSLEAAL